MNDLVTIQNEIPTVSTFDLFEVMGYKEHRALKKVIEDNISAFEDIGVMRFQMQNYKIKGGRPAKGYLLSEDQFILLAMLARNSKEVVKLKIKIATEFRRMKSFIASTSCQYKLTREDGKRIYHQKSDVIKTFVEYAKVQGSNKPEFYYSNLAKMENKALFIVEQKFPNLREILNIKQLMQVATADQVVEKALKDGMDQGMRYKEIYLLAKERVLMFAGTLGQSQVLAIESSKVKLLN